MKTLLLLMLFTFSFVFNANAQLLNIGDKWIYDTRDFSIGNGYYSEKIDSITINRDTLINGFLYFELLASEGSPCDVFETKEYLREENDSIFRLSKDLNSERLLIDFSNQSSYDMNYETNGFNGEIETTVINDSIAIEVLPSGETLEIIYQRILNNSSYSDDTVYKLSKSLGYYELDVLFPNIGTGLCDVFSSINMRCKISNSDTIKVSELGCYDSSIVSSNHEAEKEDFTFVYPNPTIGLLNINESLELLSIYDFTGKEIIYSRIDNQIDLSNVVSGIYILKLRAPDDSKLTRSVKIFKM